MLLRERKCFRTLHDTVEGETRGLDEEDSGIDCATGVAHLLLRGNWRNLALRRQIANLAQYGGCITSPCEREGKSDCLVTGFGKGFV